MLRLKTIWHVLQMGALLASISGDTLKINKDSDHARRRVVSASHIILMRCLLPVCQHCCKIVRGQTLLERRMFRRPQLLTRRNSMGY
mmetsp:Transcript_4031/g.11461  ORF Transcript_4031/g.11461 Transcript_4031/m.11461 type:complete len:87 (-) Transcript_4031:4674-4934(-)